MGIWYTTERVEIHREIDQKRTERYARRVSRAMRDAALDVEFERVKLFFGIYVYIIACAIWATM